jgi:hypothetical protein
VGHGVFNGVNGLGVIAGVGAVSCIRTMSVLPVETVRGLSVRASVVLVNAVTQFINVEAVSAIPIPNVAGDTGSDSG